MMRAALRPANPAAPRILTEHAAMLTAIRSKTGSWVVKLLFVLLIAAFAVWGIGDVFRRLDRKSDPILVVGDYRYEIADFERELRASLQRLSQAQGIQVTAAQFAAAGGAKTIVDRAERTGLMLAFGNRLGLRLPQTAIANFIAADPAFAGSDGKFDRARFEYALRQTGQSEAAYVAAREVDLRGELILRSLMAGVASPDFLSRNIYAYVAEERSAASLLIPLSAMTDIGEPLPSDLDQYLADHQADFMAPEYRNLAILQMAPADFVAGIAIDEAAIAEAYEQRKGEFSQPETRDLEQVVIQDEALVEKIAAAEAAGKDFAAAVEAATGGPAVQLGIVTRDRLPAEIADAVFALPAGAVSAPLKSPFGLHIVHVKAATEASVKPLDEVKDQIRNDLALGQAIDVMEATRAQLEDELAGGANLADAAAKLGLKLREIPAVDSLGRDSQKQDLGLPGDLLALAFAAETGTPGNVEALADGSYAVILVNSVTPEAPLTVDQARDDVIAAWKDARRAEAASAKAASIAETLKKGGDLAAEAKALGLEIKISKPFSRRSGDADADIDPVLAESLFALKPGEVAIGESATGPIVAQLSGIAPVEPAAHPEELAKMADRVRQSLGSDLGQQFYAALAALDPPERRDDLWQALIETSANESQP